MIHTHTHSRLALILSGLDFEDDRIPCDQWNDLKPQMPFGQLPVLSIDDGPLQTQSMAILRWVGLQNNRKLYPAEAVFAIEQALRVVEDLRKSWTPCLAMGRSPLQYGHSEEFFENDDSWA